MKLQRIGLTALFAIVATLSVGDWGLIVRSQVKTSMGAALAQTPADRKAEAVQLFQQGRHQFHNKQYEAALRSWQQVLAIYREIKHLQMEGSMLNLVGSAYIQLGDYSKAIDSIQQSLVIAREINDRQLKELAEKNLFLAKSMQADQLWQQGNSQVQKGFRLTLSTAPEAALQSIQQALTIYREALTIYREIKDREGEAMALRGLGNAYQQLKDFNQAIDYYQQSLTIYREIKDSGGEGITLRGLGDTYQQLKDFNQAIDYYQQWLAIAKEIQNRQDEAYALTNLGTSYRSLGDIPHAIEYFQQSLALARSINDNLLETIAQSELSIAQEHQKNLRKVEADRLLQQGVQQIQKQQYEAALQSLQQALAIYREIKYHWEEGRALVGLGAAYLFLENYPKAIEYLQQSLALAHSINDQELETLAQRGLSLAQKQSNPRKAEADRLLQQGFQQNQSNQFQAAIQSWQQALAIYQEIQDRQGEGVALGAIGDAYDSLGDYGKAIDYYQQSLTIAREIQDRRGEGAVLGNLGVTYQNLGDSGKAIDYQQQSLAIAKELQNRQSEGNALNNLGLAYYALGDYGKAIDYYQQSLALTREIKERQVEGKVLGNLGLVYRNLGDYFKAINYFQQSLVIARELQDRRTEGNALGNTGSVYRNLGDYGKAIDYAQQWLAIAREIQDPQSETKALANLGAASENLGDYSKAIEYLQQSLAIARKIKNSESEKVALGSLARTYLGLSDYSKAIDYWQQGLALARKIRDRQGETILLENLGAALFKQGNLVAAETTLLQAIEVNESIRVGLKDSEKVSIIDTQSSPYRTLQQVLISQNKTDTALEISERGRARAFVELLARRLNPTATLPTTVFKPTLSQLKKIAQIQNSTLVQYSIIYDDFKIQGKQQVKESELYIWVIKPTGEITFRKADLKPLWQQQNTSLAELVVNSRDSIGVRSNPIVGLVSRQPGQKPPDPNQQLQQLHQILIEPIADLLPTDPNAKVTFIPQHSLFLVPFAALKDKAGQYLIEKHTILTAPSIQILELTRNQKGQVGNGEALIVGNPTMPSVPPEPGELPQQLPSLPGAEKEALAIAPLFNTKAIVGNQATKASIVQQMPKARIIHLATHGLLDDGIEAGVPGAIALAPSGNDKGLLTANEILEMKLKADLVVLSACNTGRGRITGDGVVGLSRSFISAGVPSIVVSLWSVPDSPTASLMTNFYQNLQQNPNKAQALRQAMLTTMKQHPDPKDWAAFTLVGEAE